MKILITGGAGFIGSHISRLLLDAGHQVLIYDNLSKSRRESVDSRASFIKGDVLDQNLLQKSLEGVDAVYHLASLIEVSESVKFPVKFAENNVLGSLSILEAMREAQVKKILFSSSATVYGEAKTLPTAEGAPLSAANPYAASKIAVEAFMEAYHKLYGFDVVILRYFNPYGPGEDHQPETHAIPNFIKAALNKKPIPLFWKGEQIRDFIYIEDLASAHIAPLNLSGFNIFNVGAERGVKVKDVVNMISDILGYSLEVEDLGERAGDVSANYASSKLFKEKTGWQAKVSLEEGLRRTVAWFKDRSNKTD